MKRIGCLTVSLICAFFMFSCSSSGSDEDNTVTSKEAASVLGVSGGDVGSHDSSDSATESVIAKSLSKSLVTSEYPEVSVTLSDSWDSDISGTAAFTYTSGTSDNFDSVMSGDITYSMYGVEYNGQVYYLDGTVPITYSYKSTVDTTTWDTTIDYKEIMIGTINIIKNSTTTACVVDIETNMEMEINLVSGIYSATMATTGTVNGESLSYNETMTGTSTEE